MSKTLNNQQRKVLSKLYEKQFQTKEQEVRQERNNDFQELKDKLDKNIKDKDFTTYLKAYKTVKELEKVLKDRYDHSEVEFSSGSYSSDPKLSHRTHSYNGKINSKLQKHNEETNKVMDQVSIAAQDAQTRVYGLDVTFEEIKKEIDSILSSL